MTFWQKKPSGSAIKWTLSGDSFNVHCWLVITNNGNYANRRQFGNSGSGYFLLKYLSMSLIVVNFAAQREILLKMFIRV
jgi:hypothetical protein